MAQGQPQLTVAGVPIRFELTFFVIIGLLGATIAGSMAMLAAWVAIATISIVLHEMGHALAYRAYGHPSHVVLMGFGGVTTGARLSPGRSIVVSLAGPLSGIVLLGIPALAVARSDLFASDEARLVLFFFVWINLIWSFVNLLPVLPLDGGNVTQSAIELVTRRDAERTTRIVSIAVAGAAGALALVNGYLFGALFAGFFVAMNVNGLRQARLPAIQASLGEAQRALSAGDAAGAAATAEALVAQRPPRDLLAVALEIIAWAKVIDGDGPGADAALARLPNEVRPPATLSGAAAVASGRIDEGVTLLAFGFVHDRDDGPKVLAASAAAHAGQVVALSEALLALDGGAGVEAAWKVQITLHELGRYADSVAVGRALLADGRLPSAEIGYHVARSLAREGEVDDAVRWLDWVIDQGPADPSRLLSDPDLAPVRGSPAFAELHRRAEASTA
jgi:Zn-dependent protease